jgi:DNA-binding HxlR family transcriptional regulator
MCAQSLFPPYAPENQAQNGRVGTNRYILMIEQSKKFSKKTAPERSARMVETIYGCKWSLTVFSLLANGINRPGEMVRCVEGLSTKVLNECLRKNMEFGILEKTIYPELPPRVEYGVTTLGQKFLHILDDLEKLQQEMDAPATQFLS